MLPIRLFPRPSILASVTVVTSIGAGLAFGITTGVVFILAATRR